MKDFDSGLSNALIGLNLKTNRAINQFNTSLNYIADGYALLNTNSLTDIMKKIFLIKSSLSEMHETFRRELQNSSDNRAVLVFLETGFYLELKYLWFALECFRTPKDKQDLYLQKIILTLFKNDIGSVERMYDQHMFRFSNLKESFARLLKEHKKINKNYFILSRESANHFKQILPEEMELYLKEKNERHERMGGKFNGVILYTQEPSTRIHIDDKVKTALYKLIDEVQSRIRLRTQALVVSNHDFSHCLAFDIGRDFESGQLIIFAYDSSPSNMLYEISTELQKKLTNTKIYAVQTKLQKDMSSCMLYAYCTLCESAKHTLTEMVGLIKNKEFEPTFVNKVDTIPQNGEFSSNLLWCDPMDFPWLKMHLTRQSYSEIEDVLATLENKFKRLTLGHNPDKLKWQTHLSQHKSRYGNKRNEYVMRRGQAIYERLNGTYEPPSIETIRKDLSSNPKDVSIETLLRRSACGYGRISYLQRLIMELTSKKKQGALDSRSSARSGQQTALHFALERNKTYQAIYLLDGGASMDIQNSKGLTVRNILESHPDHPFFNNKALKKFIQK